MNHIYRIVWNHSNACWQAVSEIGKGRHKVKAVKEASSGDSPIFVKIRPLALLVSLLSTGLAVAAPTGGQVTVGKAEIQHQGAVTNINQSSINAVINWQNFSVKPQETVNFHQYSPYSITLNRVIGNERSVIEGAINANGNVFISNPNGVLIGGGSQINVGSLVATTQKISDEDFRNGKFQFNGQGNGKVENLGNITVPKGGVVALIAPIVKNQGKITAPQGKVVLASAEAFRISLPNEHFSYTVERGTLQGLVDNGGAILAENGHVVLTAKGLSAVKKSVIKHTGIIEANRVVNKGGVVELLGDLDNSEVIVSGKISAQGKNGNDGGSVKVQSDKTKITDTAEVNTLAQQGSKSGKFTVSQKDLIVASKAGRKASGASYNQDDITISGVAIKKAIDMNEDVELKSVRNDKSKEPSHIIIDDTINWSKNTLTLNSLNNIYINQTLNGLAQAKLFLKYGQEDFSSNKSDYILGRNVEINLPVGKSLSIQPNNNEKLIKHLQVIHEMPEIALNNDGKYTSSFKEEYIAIGKNINLSYTKDKKGFLGWETPGGFRVHGLGHKLDNLSLTVNNKERVGSKNYGIGLFSYIQGGEVRNLGIDNIDIKSNSSYKGIGGLVGYAHSININNSYTRGNINFKAVDEGNSVRIGGLAGYLSGKVTDSHSSVEIHSDNSLTPVLSNIGGLIGTNSGKVQRTFSTGHIYSKGGAENHIGGLIGNSPYGAIMYSYATGNILSEINASGSRHIRNYIGGLVGYGGNIEFNYAMGNVTSSISTSDIYIYGGNIWSGIGGLAGRGGHLNNNYAMGNLSSFIKYTGDEKINPNLVNSVLEVGGLAGEIFSSKNNYYSGTIYSSDFKNSYLGGIVGKFSRKIENSYYDFNRTNIDTAIGHPKLKNSISDNSGGKATSEMMKKSTFQDWDFNTIWRIDEGNDYPRLRALTESTLTIDTTNLGIQANELSKTYDSKQVETENDLRAIAKENGYDDIVSVSGLKDGDTLEDSSIFKGKLTYNGSWKNARNVGNYSIIPTGLSGGQKYDIKWGNGSLSISPKPVDIAIEKIYDGTNSFVHGKKISKNEFVHTTALKPLNVYDGDSVRLLAVGDLAVEGADVKTYSKFTHGGVKSTNPNYEYIPGKSTLSATIVPRKVTIEPIQLNGKKVYDGTTYADSTHVSPSELNKQLVEKDKQAGKLLTLSGSSQLVGSDVGKHKLTGLGTFALNGENAKNYLIDIKNSFWTITKRPVHLDGEHEYNKTRFVEARALKVRESDIAPADLKKGAVITVEGDSAQMDRDNVEASPAKLVNVSALKLTGDVAKNYEIAGGKVNITPKPVNVFARKIYDGSTSFVNGDIASGLSKVALLDLKATNTYEGDIVNLKAGSHLAVANKDANEYMQFDEKSEIHSDNPNYKFIADKSEVKARIDKKAIMVKALNNIRAVNGSEPTKEYLGAVVYGLILDDKIGDVDMDILSYIPSPYSDFGRDQTIGGERIIRPSNAKFTKGKSSNYDINYIDGKLLLVQDNYDVADLNNNVEKLKLDNKLREAYVNTSKEFYYDALLAKAVYGNKDAKTKGRFYEIYKVEDSRNNKVYEEMKPLDYVNKNPALKYTKLYGIVRDKNNNPVVIDNPNGKYKDDEAVGLAAALYRCVDAEHCSNRKEYYVVFRGTDTPISKALGDGDWEANAKQFRGKTPMQYIESAKFTSRMISDYIGTDYKNKMKIIGHSLGGGLAAYSSMRVGKMPKNNEVETTLLNAADLHKDNIILPEGPYSNEFLHSHYNNMSVLAYDKDILSTSNIPYGKIIKLNLLPSTSDWFDPLTHRIDDHGMDHIIMTNKLIGLVNDNLTEEEFATKYIGTSFGSSIIKPNRWFGSSADTGEKLPKPKVEIDDSNKNTVHEPSKPVDKVESEHSNKNTTLAPSKPIDKVESIKPDDKVTPSELPKSEDEKAEQPSLSKPDIGDINRDLTIEPIYPNKPLQEKESILLDKRLEDMSAQELGDLQKVLWKKSKYKRWSTSNPKFIRYNERREAYYHSLSRAHEKNNKLFASGKDVYKFFSTIVSNSIDATSTILTGGTFDSSTFNNGLLKLKNFLDNDKIKAAIDIVSSSADLLADPSFNEGLSVFRGVIKGKLDISKLSSSDMIAYMDTSFKLISALYDKGEIDKSTFVKLTSLVTDLIGELTPPGVLKTALKVGSNVLSSWSVGIELAENASKATATLNAISDAYWQGFIEYNDKQRILEEIRDNQDLFNFSYK